MAVMTVASKDTDVKDLLHALKIGLIIKEYKETPDGLEIEWEAKPFQMQKRLSDEQKEEIRKMYEAKVSVPEITKKTGIPTTSVYNILIESGLYTKKDKTDVKNRNIAIIEQRKKGITLSELAYMYAMSINGICGIIHRGEGGTLVTPETDEDIESFKSMLKDYKDVLRMHNPDLKERTEDELAEEYFSLEDTNLYLLQYGYQNAGFAVVGHGRNCHKDIDLYLKDFYIHPRFRGLGLTQKFVDLITASVNTVCFHIVKGSYWPDFMWEFIFREWKNISAQVPDTFGAPDEPKWYVFEKTDETEKAEQKSPQQMNPWTIS